MPWWRSARSWSTRRCIEDNGNGVDGHEGSVLGKAFRLRIDPVPTVTKSLVNSDTPDVGVTATLALGQTASVAVNGVTDVPQTHLARVPRWNLLQGRRPIDELRKSGSCFAGNSTARDQAFAVAGVTAAAAPHGAPEQSLTGLLIRLCGHPALKW